MKKIAILCLTLALTIGAQAQLGGLGSRIGNSVRKSVEKKVEDKAKQKAEQEVDKALDRAFGLDKNQQSQQIDRSSVSKPRVNDDNTIEEGKIPTPEEVMNSVPSFPTEKNIADYLCEQSRENPNAFRIMANPTVAFMTQMGLAAASGAVTMFASAGSGHILYYDEALLKELGIDEKDYENMSEAEKEELARKYSEELKERYLRTAEMLGNDKQYNEMLDQYNEIDNKIEELYTNAENKCKEIWKGKFAAKEDLCGYYHEAVPIYYTAVTEAMKMRKAKQLDIAKKIDIYVQKLADSHRGEVYAGFYNQGGVCATSYVGDAARLLSISDPR
jgi:hypothetical protein